MWSARPPASAWTSRGRVSASHACWRGCTRRPGDEQAALDAGADAVARFAAGEDSRMLARAHAEQGDRLVVAGRALTHHDAARELFDAEQYHRAAAPSSSGEPTRWLPRTGQRGGGRRGVGPAPGRRRPDHRRAVGRRLAPAARTPPVRGRYAPTSPPAPRRSSWPPFGSSLTRPWAGCGVRSELSSPRASAAASASTPPCAPRASGRRPPRPAPVRAVARR